MTDNSNIYLIGEQTRGIKPEIAQIDLISVLEDGSSTPIAVEAVKGVDLEKVWVQVIPRDADITGGDRTTVYPEIEIDKHHRIIANNIGRSSNKYSKL